MLDLIAQTSRPHIDMEHWTPGAVLEMFKWILSSSGAIALAISLWRNASKKEVQQVQNVQQQQHAESTENINKLGKGVLTVAEPGVNDPLTMAQVRDVVSSTGDGAVPRNAQPASVDLAANIGSALKEGNQS